VTKQVQKCDDVLQEIGIGSWRWGIWRRPIGFSCFSYNCFAFVISVSYCTIIVGTADFS